MNATAATVAAEAVPVEKMQQDSILQTNLTLQNWARPTELTIDYTIPELIHSIELVQRQVRIQWSHYSQKRSAAGEGELRGICGLKPTDVLCVSTNRPASATTGNWHLTRTEQVPPIFQ